ncbi:MAG: hypothetical protein IKU37_08570 [Candidatus Gastranaerophilales bacterium]|nr:hypothetical protein [Candidatus Gastranaerophilales bacterium]
MKKALSLAESMIVLIIIAFIAMLMLSTFNKLQPDKNKIMFKKAYSITERVVGELINDESIYPYDPNRLGFRNTDKACISGLTREECDDCVPSTEFQGGCFGGGGLGKLKFMQFFARKLNIIGAPALGSPEYFSMFETTDGLKWTILNSVNNNSWLVIVDVNGDNGPNIPEMQSPMIYYGDRFEERIPNDLNRERDRLFILVGFDGRVRVLPNSIEAEYLKSHETTRRN